MPEGITENDSESRIRLFATPQTIESVEFSSQNTVVGSLSLLRGIFPTQGSNPGLPHCRQILYQLSHKETQEYWRGSLSLREGNGTPLQYSCLENPMDGGAWKAAVHGVA